MNSNTLPIALMQTMSGSLSLKWKPDDTPAKALDRSFQYLVLCAVLGALLRWSVGIALLNSSDEPAAKANPKHFSMITLPITPLEPNFNGDSSRYPSGPISRPETLLLSRLHRDGHSSYPVSITPNSAVFSYDLEAPTPSTSVHQADLQKDALMKTKTGTHDPKPSKKVNIRQTWRGVRRTMKKLKTRLSISDKSLEALSELLNPPLLSSIAAIIVACIPPFQHSLAKVKPLREFISTAGAVAIPLTLVLLGAFFYRPPNDTKPQADHEKTQLEKEKRIQSRRTLIVITLTLLARHVVTPLIILPLLALICQNSHFEVVKDPVFILCATLIIGGPPAITLAQMTSKTNVDSLDEMVSKLLLWSYALATPITTILLVLGAGFIYNSIL